MWHNLRAKALVEWLFWVGLVAVLWRQTEKFSQPIADFRFGADGWPKAVLIFLALGATLQLIVSWRAAAKPLSASASPSPSASASASPPLQQPRLRQTWRIVGIFCLPLLYLWLIRRAGFFLITPMFVLTYLWILEVRRWDHLLAVSASVYGFVLLIFVRLFYVALPVGSWQWCYEINNRIITLVRWGL